MAGTLMWRGLIILVSAAGFAGVAIIWSRLDDAGMGYLLLTSLPFLMGLASAAGRMEPQNRILLMWLAAGIAGLVAAVTIMSGAGLILLGGMVLYLVASWGMNESHRRIR